MNITIQTALLGTIIDSLLDGDVNTAIVRLLRMQRELTSQAPNDDRPQIRVDRDDRAKPASFNPVVKESDFDDLPPLIPLNPGRKIKAKELLCPTCKAKPGTECFEMSSRGPHGVPTNVHRANGSTTHTARRRSASARNA